MIHPRKIILQVVLSYLDEEIGNKLKKEVVDTNYKSDYKFIQLLEKYFDFSTLIYNPKKTQDAWIYNYLMYETKFHQSAKPLQKGNKIHFEGRMPRKGLILKYSIFLKNQEFVKKLNSLPEDQQLEIRKRLTVQKIQQDLIKKYRDKKS